MKLDTQNYRMNFGLIWLTFLFRIKLVFVVVEMEQGYAKGEGEQHGSV